MISIIAAIGENNEIGKNNELLWHLPADMKHFKETTMLHAVLMGRKTFESIGKALPNRRNIIITRDANYKKEGVEIAHSLSGALDLFSNQKEEIFVIGGGDLYKQAMPIAQKLYITHIQASDKDADTFFPEITQAEWSEISRTEHEADEKNPIPYTFSVYKRLY